MRVVFNGKSHNIDDKTLSRIMKNLPCTKDQAIQIYAEDEGWIINQNTIEMDKAEKEQKEILRYIHDATSQKVVDKKMNGQATRGTGAKKKDDTKIEIINTLSTFLNTMYENVVVVNDGKLITFTVNSEPYKLDLTKTRVPKVK